MADLDPAAVSSPPAPPAETALAGASADVAPLPGSTHASPQSASETLLPARARLLERAQAEIEDAQRMASLQKDASRREALIAAATPACYLDLVARLRTAVRAFNESLIDVPEEPISRIVFYESPNVSLQDPVTGDGMRVRVSRHDSYFDLILRMISRSRKPDVPLIEGYGSIGRGLLRKDALLRVESSVEDGHAKFWLSLNFKRQNISLEEIADRIVLAVASHDQSCLSRNLGPSPTPPRAQSDSSPGA